MRRLGIGNVDAAVMGGGVDVAKSRTPLLGFRGRVPCPRANEAIRACEEMETRMMAQNTIWNASGKRHATELGAKLKPRSIQQPSVMPKVMSAPSIMAIFPCLCGFKVSDYQVGICREVSNGEGGGVRSRAGDRR